MRSGARFLVFAFLALQNLAFGQTLDPSMFGGLRYRLLGPSRGGRAIATTGVPRQLEKFYFGAVGGGVWETDNAGRTLQLMGELRLLFVLYQIAPQ
jgi:hypothetical protein